MAEIFDAGRKIFSWTARDYHPHTRGWIWLTIFCGIFFGGGIWAIFAGDTIMALTFFLLAAVYFYAHKNGDETHEIVLCEKGFFVDRTFFLWEKFSGFWLIFDETAAIINFQFAHKNAKISLQMGKIDPEIFRKIFARAEFPELDKQETLLDLWIRALKL